MVIKLEFVDFVVSDSPTAYPDGGEQDGYWYEKVNTGDMSFIDAFKAIGCSKVAVDKFIPTTTDYAENFTIPHSHGGIPTISLLFHESPTVMNIDDSRMWGILAYTGTSTGLHGVEIARSGVDATRTVSDCAKIKLTSTTITPYGKYGGKLVAGVEYTLITLS